MIKFDLRDPNLTENIKAIKELQLIGIHTDEARYVQQRLGEGRYFVPRGVRNKETLCWECKKSGGLCSWSHSLTPVEGWVAETSTRKTYIGDGTVYCVISCPEFERG